MWNRSRGEDDTHANRPVGHGLRHLCQLNDGHHVLGNVLLRQPQGNDRHHELLQANAAVMVGQVSACPEYAEALGKDELQVRVVTELRTADAQASGWCLAAMASPAAAV